MTDDGLVIILLWQIFGAFISSSTDNVTRKYQSLFLMYTLKMMIISFEACKFIYWCFIVKQTL